jgi:LuxR family quorum sensing-dependent transcriptional regulator
LTHACAKLWRAGKALGGGTTVSAQALDYGRYAFDVVDRIERLTTRVEILDCLGATLREFGFTSFLVTDLPDSGRDATFLLNGWPAEWAEHYNRENYYDDDPIATWGRRTVNPFEWSEVQIDVERNPRALEVLRAGREFRRNAGFVVPVCHVDSPKSAVTMCGEQPNLHPNAKRAVHFISLFAHSKAASLMNQENANHRSSLTEGEREVLKWTAAGKSAWDVSVILGIAESTVVWRLKQASAKLNAVNKVQAVVNAIRTNQISV